MHSLMFSNLPLQQDSQKSTTEPWQHYKVTEAPKEIYLAVVEEGV